MHWDHSGRELVLPPIKLARQRILLWTHFDQTRVNWSLKFRIGKAMAVIQLNGYPLSAALHDGQSIRAWSWIYLLLRRLSGAPVKWMIIILPQMTEQKVFYGGHLLMLKALGHVAQTCYFAEVNYAISFGTFVPLVLPRGQKRSAYSRISNRGSTIWFQMDTSEETAATNTTRPDAGHQDIKFRVGSLVFLRISVAESSTTALGYSAGRSAHPEDLCYRAQCFSHQGFTQCYTELATLRYLTSVPTSYTRLVNIHSGILQMSVVRSSVENLASTIRISRYIWQHAPTCNIRISCSLSGKISKAGPHLAADVLDLSKSFPCSGQLAT
ncbi:hypothetical protein A0H81_11594 [Grifola frondosa]|uniref:Uncharacterized protein n=1 Tax=Grifola frondosa TaxID=5627 RepID=A0A1C7LUS0_GRIFR|nr:hypothetical protein A0H81_11594 [Grifola frondosa]